MKKGRSRGVGRAENGLGYWVQLACMLDAMAPKPGNVHRGRDFADCGFEDFIMAAWALGPVFAQSQGRPVGKLVQEAVQATREVSRGNPNLGMILLFAPLARAYQEPGPGSLRERVRKVLASTGYDDARAVYAAIVRAEAGGMGEVEEQDLGSRPQVDLLEAMRLARARDSVAAEYAYGYHRTFCEVFPALVAARCRCRHWSPAVVETFLHVLARVPDTLIARKEGWAQARRVSSLARAALAAGATRTWQGQRALEKMERELRARDNRLNPGTSADLTAAGLLVYFLTYGHQEFVHGAPGGGSA